MSKKHCVFVPSKGQTLFRNLRKEFDYNTAKEIFLLAINPNFIKDYKNTLSLDAEGVPSFSSVMSNSYIKKFVGDNNILKVINKNFNSIEDTLDNYNILLGEALNFNQSSEYKDDYIAIVIPKENSIKVEVVPKTPEQIDYFNNQYSAYKANQLLLDTFSNIGITLEMLTQSEVDNGRVGYIDFSKAKELSKDFSSIIRVANNMEGSQSISEEFSHLIIGAFRKEPLIDRSINYLSNNIEDLQIILGDQLEDVVNYHQGDMLLVAEEALGQLLQKNLINNVSLNNVKAPSLFSRVINYIKSKFIGYNPETLDYGIQDIELFMSELSKNIINGSKSVSVDDIMKIERDDKFNSLSNRIDRNIKILQEAENIESKRYKLLKNKSIKDKVESTISDIQYYINEDVDTAIGILKYGKSALTDLTNLNDRLDNMSKLDVQERFKLLRDVRTYSKSYSTFIQAINDAYAEEYSQDNSLSEEELLELNKGNLFSESFDVEGTTISMLDILKDINSANNLLGSRFTKFAIPMLAEYYKPFFGDVVEITSGKLAGTSIKIEDIFTEATKDITFTDKWLDSMGDSADILLQLMDSLVKDKKDQIRLDTISTGKKIQALQLKAESYGITDFEWMFELDNEGNKTGNYISEVNTGQFDKELEEFYSSLDKEYGINPTGNKAVEKINKKNKWLSENAVSRFGTPIANPSKYKNTKYYNLNRQQLEILQEFLNIKYEQDSKYPEGTTYTNTAIQIRKTSTQRSLDLISNPSNFISNIQESLKEAWLDAEDDIDEYGESVKNSITNFEGGEYMMLPTLYTRKLKNPNELSTDIFSSLMQYVYATNNYEGMSSIVDPLEVTKIIANENREVYKTRGGETLVERFKSFGKTITNRIVQTDNVNIVDKINTFLDSQVYGKYHKDEGTFNMLGLKINKNKAVRNILNMSTYAGQAFNPLSQMANIVNGVSMTNIEAAAGQYFSVKTLAQADGIYTKELPSLFNELASLNKTNKLSLFTEFFNTNQNFKNVISKVRKSNIVERVLGEQLGYLGQTGGDHWLYNRTAIAMALQQKVKLSNGKITSLWDALEIKSVGNNTKIKEMYLPEGTTYVDGSPVDIKKFSRKIAKINQGLFGIYNEEDSNAAKRTITGKLLSQYRGYLKAAMNKRFQQAQYSNVLEGVEEGYYMTFGRLLNNLVRGKFTIASAWGDMADYEKANIKRSITEILQFFAVWSIANMVEWGDDEDRPYLEKLAKYLAHRASHELGGLTPSFTFIEENMKLFKTPMAVLPSLDKIINLTIDSFNPNAYTDEIQSGQYEGMSTIEKRWLEAPFYGISAYRHLNKDLDTSVLFYTKPY